MNMKFAAVACFGLFLGAALTGCSTSWPEKAAGISVGTTRAQVNEVLPVWEDGWVVDVGGSNHSYWVSTNWMVTVRYDSTGGEGSMGNRTIARVTAVKAPYPNIEAEVNLLMEFKNSKDFCEQSMIGNKLAALYQPAILQSLILTDDLTNEDRHIRANAAFVFAALGDPRGFETLVNILDDRSPRPEGQGVGCCPWTLQEQIASDRYYAAHVLGDLKDPRALPILIPLLKDNEVNYIVPWSLSQIGGEQAVHALIDTLGNENPSIRVLAIYGLEDMHAVEALPRLRQMVNDEAYCDVDDLISVGDAARGVIAELEPHPDPIDRLAASLSSSQGLWVNGLSPLPIQLPPSATQAEVLARSFQDAGFDSGRVRQYRVLDSRQVIVLHRVGKYVMVLVKTNLGKMIVMTDYSKNGKGWSYRIYKT